MLPTLKLISVFFFCIAAQVGFVFAQENERVPSGDLSNFFNPPGIKTDGLNSRTRKIKLKEESTSSKIDSATNSTEPMKGTSAPEDPVAKTGEKKKAADVTASTAAPDSKSADAKPADTSGQVQIESQDLAAIEGGISFGPPTKTNWRVGVVMATGTNNVRNVQCRIPVPVQWPEQKVAVFDENLPPEITDVGWEDLGNIRLMTFRITSVPAGEKFVATVTFQVETSQIIAPKNTSIFRIPDKKTRDIKPYFGESPGISLRNTKLKKQAKLLFGGGLSDWAKVESAFDWVRDNIEERTGESKGSIEAFKNKFGTGEDRVSLFVAMCRINKVPARMVFIDGSQYAEFYMVDDKKQGHWFPAQVTGIREFGSVGEPRVILQKGDNYKVPGEKKKLKFVPATGTVKNNPPRLLKFAREPLSVK